MYRVELKVIIPKSTLFSLIAPVPNVPCGVESWWCLGDAMPFLPFFVPNVPCGVESTFAGRVRGSNLAQVPNVPCGVERLILLFKKVRICS